MFLPTDDSKRRAQIIETMMAMPNDVAIPMVQAMMRFDAMATLRVLDVPVMCISSAVPTNDAASLLDACPWITLGQTVGAGHFLQLEVPGQVGQRDDRTVPRGRSDLRAREAVTMRRVVRTRNRGDDRIEVVKKHERRTPLCIT